jgi:hypothetical protein
MHEHITPSMLTEKEKCLAGLLYDANNDPQLLADRDRCHVLCVVAVGNPCRILKKI